MTRDARPRAAARDVTLRTVAREFVRHPSPWRHRRLHHFKNEHQWFTVTSAGTADRVLGTHPDPQAVPTSPTAKDLHAHH